MKRPNTNLASLTFSRTAPRPAADRSEVGDGSPVAAKARRPAPGRRVLVGGHYDPEVSYALLELIGKLARQRGERVTVQSALAEGLRMLFERYNEPVPAGLLNVP